MYEIAVISEFHADSEKKTYHRSLPDFISNPKTSPYFKYLHLELPMICSTVGTGDNYVWVAKIIKIWRNLKDQKLFLSAANWPSCSIVPSKQCDMSSLIRNSGNVDLDNRQPIFYYSTRNQEETKSFIFQTLSKARFKLGLVAYLFHISKVDLKWIRLAFWNFDLIKRS